MKNTFAKHTFQAVVLAMALSSTLAMAQKRGDILSIQRDIAQLRSGETTANRAGSKDCDARKLIKQALDESGKVSSAAAALQQQMLTDRLNSQQAQVEASIQYWGPRWIDPATICAPRVKPAGGTSRGGWPLWITNWRIFLSAVRYISTPTAAPPTPAAGDSAGTAAASVTSARRPALG